MQNSRNRFDSGCFDESLVVVAAVAASGAGGAAGAALVFGDQRQGAPLRGERGVQHVQAGSVVAGDAGVRDGVKAGLSDVAAALNTNQRNISGCVKSMRDCSFAQFVNNYRIDYAKQLLRTRPDIKLTEVYLKSGFANETSFFRTFKAITGQTPKEWMTSTDSLKGVECLPNREEGAY